MGFFISANKNRKRQKIIFLVTAIFLAAGLVGSTLIGVFGGGTPGNVNAEYQPPESAAEKVTGLEKQMEENPGDVVIMGKLAEEYYRNGQVDKSLETYEKALQADPDNHELRTSLAVTYFLENKSDRAVEEIKKVIDGNPDNQEAHYYLGLFLAYGQGEYEQALQELHTFIDTADPETMSGKITTAKEMIAEIEDMNN
jgi:cytochrome c-type biogenesis protein CcmH/NrfG